MNLSVFEKFDQECVRHLADSVDEILKAGREKNACAISFMTTDDFYGCYLAWDYSNNIEEYYDWKQGSEPDFLYEPLVELVDSCEEIDFCNKSEEKWEFAMAFLAVLEKNIKQIPDEIFQKNNFRREDVLFFATMSDGDYVEEMLDASVKMFNTPETRKAYFLTV